MRKQDCVNNGAGAPIEYASKQAAIAAAKERARKAQEQIYQRAREQGAQPVGGLDNPDFKLVSKKDMERIARVEQKDIPPGTAIIIEDKT